MRTRRIIVLSFFLALSMPMAWAENSVTRNQGVQPGSGDDSAKRSNNDSVRPTVPATETTSRSVYVRGHKTKNGAYVKGHRRSKPDHSFGNNWTTKGNDNPYTGKEGSKLTRPEPKP